MNTSLAETSGIRIIPGLIGRRFFRYGFIFKMADIVNIWYTKNYKYLWESLILLILKNFVFSSIEN
jgi:hypothetical protein